MIRDMLESLTQMPSSSRSFSAKCVKLQSKYRSRNSFTTWSLTSSEMA